MEAVEYLQVDFLQGEGGGVLDTLLLEAEAFRSEEEAAVAALHSHAEQLVPPGHTVRRLMYKDDEGDWCTLNVDTVRDALSFVVPSDDIGHIQFRIVATIALPAPEAPREPAAPTDQGSASKPAPRELVPGQASEAEELVFREWAELATHTDMRQPVPKVAIAALHDVAQDFPDHSELLEVAGRLAAFRDGGAQARAGDLTLVLSSLFDTILHLPAEVRSSIVARMQVEATQVRQEIEDVVREGGCEKDLALTEGVGERAGPEESEATMVEAMPPPPPSAWVLSCSGLAAGAGAASEDCSARGDATAEFADILADFGVRQAARLGRVVVNAAEDTPEVPILAKCIVKNDGEVPWPDTVAVTFMYGEDFTLRHMPLGALGPGEAAEVVIDLRLPARCTPSSSSASWVFVDVATGVPLGPILIFEALWVA